MILVHSLVLGIGNQLSALRIFPAVVTGCLLRMIYISFLRTGTVVFTSRSPAPSIMSGQSVELK